ncbi:MAG TPA: flagellar hook-associated protein FlgL [Solirubrobacteraceae bacterium]|nr:flagellar hook-associated protein FlgL [Solirubrobacteraceae bacterium]
MIGRITNQMTASMMLSGIESDLDQLDTTQQELSTGLTINEPSDNPSGTSLVLALNTTQSNLTSYSNNVSDGTGWSDAATSALSDMTNAVQRVQELVEEAANGTQNQSDMSASADEVNQLIDEIKSDADTQYNGQYIFSGSATTTQPYQSGSDDTYAGNTASVTREIGPGTSLAVNVDLSSVLGNGQTTSGQPSGDGLLLNTLRNIADDMQSGNSSALSGTDLADLTNNLNSLTALSTNMGAVTDRLQMASSRITSLQNSTTDTLSNTEDADMAATETKFSSEQAAFEAALQGGADIVQESLMNFLGSGTG